MTPYAVTTVAPDRATAHRLAESSVTARLAATAQVHGPVTAYWWHLDEQGSGEEWLVLLKTTSTRYPALEAHLLAEHPWDNPEITATRVEAGSPAYLTWLDRATHPPERA